MQWAGKVWRGAPEYLVLALIAAAVAYQLFVPPIIGLADNGDFARIIGKYGIVHPTNDSSEFFKYIVTKWKIDSGPGWDSGYLSSERMFLWAALPLNRLVSPPAVFDLRVMGFVHFLFYIAALWVLMMYTRTLSVAPRLIALALMLLIFTDVGYVEYLNTFYSEPASFVFFIATVALILHLIRKPDLRLLVLYAGCAIAFITAKAQNGALAAFIAIFTVLLLTLRTDRVWRAACLVTAVAIGYVAYQFSTGNPSFTYRNTYYTAVFTNILANSPTPTQDLQEFGVNPALARFGGTTPFTSGTDPYGPEFDSFYQNVTFKKIAEFYLRHPSRIREALDRNSFYALMVRPFWQGNFDASAKLPPLTTSHAFSIWSDFKFVHGPKSATPFEWYFGLNAVGILALFFLKKSKQVRMTLALQVLLLTMALFQLAVVTVTIGTVDAVKQLSLFSLICETSAGIALVWIASEAYSFVALRIANRREQTSNAMVAVS